MKVIGAQFEKDELRIVLAEEPEQATRYVAELIGEAVGHPLAYKPGEGLAVLDRKAMQEFHLIPGVNIAIGDQPETSRTRWKMDSETWKRLGERGVAVIHDNFITEHGGFPWDSRQELEREGIVGGFYHAGREYSVKCQGPMPCEDREYGAATMLTVRPEGIGSSFALQRIARKLSA